MAPLIKDWCNLSHLLSYLIFQAHSLHLTAIHTSHSLLVKEKSYLLAKAGESSKKLAI